MTKYPRTVFAAASSEPVHDTIVVTLPEAVLQAAGVTAQHICRTLNSEDSGRRMRYGVRDRLTLVFLCEGRAPGDGSFARQISDRFLGSAAGVNESIETCVCAQVTDASPEESFSLDVIKELQRIEDDELCVDVLIANNSDHSIVQLPHADKVTIHGTIDIMTLVCPNVFLSPGQTLAATLTFYPNRSREMRFASSRLSDTERLLYGEPIVIVATGGEIAPASTA